MLHKIIEDNSNTTFDYIEAYPKKGKSSMNNFNGPFELYRKNDFEIYKEHEKYYVMRRQLK